MENRGMPFGRRPSTVAIRRALTRLAAKQAPGVWLCARRERPRRAKQIPLEMGAAEDVRYSQVWPQPVTEAIQDAL